MGTIGNILRKVFFHSRGVVKRETGQGEVGPSGSPNTLPLTVYPSMPCTVVTLEGDRVVEVETAGKVKVVVRLYILYPNKYKLLDTDTVTIGDITYRIIGTDNFAPDPYCQQSYAVINQ